MKNKFIFIAIFALLVLAILFVLRFQRKGEEVPEEVRNLVLPISARHFYMGVTANPSSKAKQDFEGDLRNSFREVGEVGELVNYAGGWIGPSGNYLSKQIEVIYPLVKENNLKLVVQMSFFKLPESGNPIRDGLPLILPKGLSAENLSDPEFRRLYISEAVKIAENFHPDYLIAGIEVNIYYMFERDDFENFLTLYFEIYDAVKKVSPTTLVFVSFNFELMVKGFPGYDENPHWNLIDKFGDKLDLIGFTTYPFRDYSSPNSIPINYYTQILNYTNKRIAFTEIGWPTKNNEREQLKFIVQFLNLTKSLNIEFIQWIYLHDLSPHAGSIPLKNIMGLRTYDDKPKLSWYAWRKIYKLPLSKMLQCFDMTIDLNDLILNQPVLPLLK